MKKQLLFGVALALTSLLPNGLFAQSTQGTDFWVTFMRGDRGKSGTDNGYDKLLLKTPKKITWIMFFLLYCPEKCCIIKWISSI